MKYDLPSSVLDAVQCPLVHLAFFVPMVYCVLVSEDQFILYEIRSLIGVACHMSLVSLWEYETIRDVFLLQYFGPDRKPVPFM